MRWKDLDLDRKTLLIPETKNGDARVIPLGSEAIAVLNRVPKTKDKVFPLSADALRLSWTETDHADPSLRTFIFTISDTRQLAVSSSLVSAFPRLRSSVATRI